MPATFTRRLQLMRDEATLRCQLAVRNGDRDTADALEEIGRVLDRAQLDVRLHEALVNERRGLMDSSVRIAD